jgi:hypothetical protein
MNTETVRKPAEAMNARSEEQAEIEAKPIACAANSLWLRYPMLVITIWLLAVLTWKARELTQNILAGVGPVEEWLNQPY